MKLKKALKRDRDIDRRKNGMRIDGKGVFIQEEEKYKRSQKIKRDRKEKEEARENS